MGKTLHEGSILLEDINETNRSSGRTGKGNIDQATEITNAERRKSCGKRGVGDTYPLYCSHCRRRWHIFGHGRAAAALRLGRAELAIFRPGTHKNVLRG